jgi:hypothetical protein
MVPRSLRAALAINTKLNARGGPSMQIARKNVGGREAMIAPEVR